MREFSLGNKAVTKEFAANSKKKTKK